MTAKIGSPPACASRKRFNTSTAHPSLRTNPSAFAENVLQRPSGASARVRETATVTSGLSTRFAAAASASEHSSRRSASQA